MKLKHRFLYAIWHHARERKPLSHSLFKLASNYRDAYLGESYEISENGEERVLRKLAGSLNVIFDVGANIGRWSLAAQRWHPRATIYAFELCPEPFSRLSEVACGNIIPINIGLYNKSEVVSVCVEDNDARSFITAGQATGNTHLPVLRGDAFCAERGIASIDFLKWTSRAPRPLYSTDLERCYLKFLSYSSSLASPTCIGKSFSSISTAGLVPPTK